MDNIFPQVKVTTTLCRAQARRGVITEHVWVMYRLINL